MIMMSLQNLRVRVKVKIGYGEVRVWLGLGVGILGKGLYLEPINLIKATMTSLVFRTWDSYQQSSC